MIKKEKQIKENEMNEAIENFCIRMATEDKKTKEKTIENCTVDEYLDYLEKLCNFCEGK